MQYINTVLFDEYSKLDIINLESHLFFQNARHFFLRNGKIFSFSVYILLRTRNVILMGFLGREFF